MPRFSAATKAWDWAGRVGTAHWLWTLGGGAVLSSILRAILSLYWPWVVLMGFGIALMGGAIVATIKGRRRKPPALQKLTLGEPVGDRDLSSWRGIHYVDSTYGDRLPGIWLKAKSIDGDKRRIHRCEVKHADGVAIAPMEMDWPSQFGGEPEYPEMASQSVLFPKDFKQGDVPYLPLKSGEYIVTWFAIGPDFGEQFLVSDAFEMNDGRLVWRESTFLTKWECVTRVEVVPGDSPMSDGLLTLMAASDDERAEMLLCYVIEPDEQRRSPKQPERQPTRSAHYFYPQDFDTPLTWPLPPGDYQVVWQARRFFNDGIRYMPMERVHFHVDMGGAVKVREPEPLMERVDDEDFSWSNMYAADGIEPYLHDSLSLSLSGMTDPMSRWRRGVICTVRAPDESEYHSSRTKPDEQGEVKLLYPRDFEGGKPVADGTYVVTWRGAASDDPEIITSRPFPARLVVLSGFWQGRRPGSKWVLHESEAREVVRDGVGTYLFEDQE